MSRLNRDESLEVFTLLVRANTQVISTALSLSRIGMKNDAQFSALQKQLRGTEGDVRQAALLSLQKAGILDPSLSWAEVRHLR